MAVLWLTVFRFQVFSCICLIAAFSSCCSWEWRLAAVRASLQEPSRTLEHLPQPEEMTPWDGAPLHTDRPKRKDLCMGKELHLTVVPVVAQVAADVQTSCSQVWAEWSAFSSTSDLLTGHWHEISLWYPWYPSGLTDLPHLQAERRPGTVAYHRAPEHSPCTHRQLHSKFNINCFICCGFFLTFLSVIVWLHTVNENCCMQRALFCYQLNSRSLAGFFQKPEVVAVISFLLENFPFPQGSVQGNMLVCSHTFTM